MPLLAASAATLLLCCERVVGIRSHEFGRARTGTTDAAAGGGAGSEGTNQAGAPDISGGSASGPVPVPPADDEAPFVLRVQPADAMRGVVDSPLIVVEFSEPMDTASVEREYFQEPSGGLLSWNADGTTLTVSTALNRRWSHWTDFERSGSPADLAVTYGVGPRARDRAGNPMADAFTATYYLVRHVEHRLAACPALSGTASALGFQAVSALEPSDPCQGAREGTFIPLLAGDQDGQAVVALLSYSLAAVPTDASLENATLAFAFDDPIGEPHDVYGALLLEETHFGLDASGGFESQSVSPLGVLAVPNAVYPLRPTKDVTSTVRERLAPRSDDALMQFRARFANVAADANGMPDYVRLDAPTIGAPTLLLTYSCTACP